MSFAFRKVWLVITLAAITPIAAAAPVASTAVTLMNLWRTAFNTGNANAMRANLYDSGPATVTTPSGEISALADAQFWIKLRQAGRTVATFEDIQTGTAGPGQQQIILRIVLSGHSAALKPAFVNAALVWAKSGNSWRIVAAKRTDPARLRQPIATKDLYPASRDARSDIYNAQLRATRAGKNLIIVFGANWCYDCHVLDLAFEKGEVAELVRPNFEVVHVDIGQGEKNQDLMRLYGVATDRGIPAVAVLDGKGALLTGQRSGEFAPARRLGPEDLESFLRKWKPKH